MANKNQANVRIYGDDGDAVYVGPKGVTFPTGIEAPTGNTLEAIGWLGEDGINLDQDITVNTFNGHQGGAQLRQKKSAVSRSFTFQALEETATTLGLYYPGLTATTSGSGAESVTTFAVPAGARSDERAWMIETWDDDIWKRYNIPVGEVGETGTVSHTNSGLTIYEFTVAILGGFDIVSNNPAFVKSVAV